VIASVPVKTAMVFSSQRKNGYERRSAVPTKPRGAPFWVNSSSKFSNVGLVTIRGLPNTSSWAVLSDCTNMK
jgi:hypothetical protein